MNQLNNKLIWKRLLDIVLGSLALVILSPIMWVLIILIRLNMGGEVFFKQIRPGLKGEPFLMWKFRTMTHDRDLEGKLLPDMERITRLGRILRSTSLDELPEIYNVLKGEMSLVGPRPLLMQYLPRYSPEQRKRHDLKPGITGWAQINGRNAISWEEKFTLDVWYVNNVSFGLDIRILALTIKKIIYQEGITQSETITMEEFMGTQ